MHIAKTCLINLEKLSTIRNTSMVLYRTKCRGTKCPRDKVSPDKESPDEVSTGRNVAVKIVTGRSVTGRNDGTWCGTAFSAASL